MSVEISGEVDLDIPVGWDFVPLEKLVDPSRGISYGIVQPGRHDPGGVPIVRVTDVCNGQVDTHDVLRVARDIESTYERTRLRGGEILLSLVGTLGECAIASERLRGWNVARAIGVIPVAPESDPQWVALCLRSVPVQALMRAWATTTVQATLNLREVRRLPILMPPKALRARITETMTALGDKIEQNRQTAQSLEQLAHAIFRAWFVDFEPVKAKAAGATAFPSMPQAAFDALPTHFVDSAIGPVPEGWVVKAIGDVVTTKGGGTPSTKNADYWDGGEHCWATPKDMSRLAHPVLLDTERRITDAGVNAINSGVLPAGTVLMSSRAPVGYLAIAGIPTAINQGFIAMVCDGPLPPTYIFNWALASLDAIKAHASGTTFPEISKKNFRPLPVVLPTPDVVTAYRQVADPLFDLLTACVKESQQLSVMRDYLLPKLLSGEVRVEAAHG